MIKLYIMPHLEKTDLYVKYLSETAKIKYNHYKHTLKKKSVISTELLLNYAFYDVFKDDISYPIETKITKLGKPYDEDCKIHFSKSHGKDYGVVVIHKDLIGCDIEYIHKDYQYVDHVLNALEFNAYELESIEDKSKVFFKYWTAKEAFLKLKGIGIRDKLSNLHYKYTTKKTFIEGLIMDCHIHQFIYDNHMVAVASTIKDEIDIIEVNKDIIEQFISKYLNTSN